MRTRNLTPFLFGAKVTSRLPPQLEMAMIVRGTFTLRPNAPVAPLEGLAGGALEQGPLTAEVFAEDDEDRTGGCLYPGDFADFKPHAEVFLIGSSHVPAGKPVRECGVRFAVGPWSKSLYVVGKRTWGVMGPSAPAPFEKMPIGWSHSFGGPKYEKNPSGKGFGTAELPNVESPSARVSSKSDRPDPAGFGPLSPWWPQRADKMSKSMFKAGAPHFLAGIDWTRFNGAPLDQQLKGFLHGDEELVLQNLHPDVAVFSARLPALRIRSFAKLADGSIGEARMNLDTLLVDTEKAHLVLTWRGHVNCQETDLSDVKSVLVASEPLASGPLPADHYKGLLEAFHADPVGVMADEMMPGARKRLATVQAAGKEYSDHPERTQAEHGLALLKNEDVLTLDVAEGDRAEVLQGAASARAQLEDAIAKEKEAGTRLGGRPPKTANELAEEAPDVHAQVIEELKKARAAAEKAGSPLDDIEKLERMIEEPRAKQVLRGPPRAAELGPGKDLSGRVMSGRDLSGHDLSGANLEGALLMGAMLVGTRLAGANLREAILMNADLSLADLSGADLTRALLIGARAPGADFRRTTIEMALLGETNLEGANFGGARLSSVVMGGANLTGAKLEGVDFLRVAALGARMEKADFTGAKLVKCSFARCKASGATFQKSVLTNTSFMESELRGASFVEASGEQTNFMLAELGGADFRFAALHAAHFMDAKAVGSNFYGADLRGAEFVRACLDRAVFRKANLFGANLDRSQLNDTTFLDANLYEARLETARGKNTVFVGANTKKALMPS